MRKINLLVLMLGSLAAVFGQSTYETVYSILQTNCTGSCHNYSTTSSYNLNFMESPDSLYNQLVSVPPANAAAAAAGMMLVDPGNSRGSFLFAKMSHGLDANLNLTAGEGADMDSLAGFLSQTQREMIRQWIIFGAFDTGTYTSQTLIDSFYVGDGGNPRIPPIAPPAPGTGVQLYYGPIFMAPGVEHEWNDKYYIKNNEVIDVHGMQTQENPQTHHFAIYDFFPGHDTLIPKGLRLVVGISDEAFLFYNANVVAQWPKSMDVMYPAGLGQVWSDSTVLALDYHLINWDDSIIAAEAYLNIYYSPHDPSVIPIQTYPLRYGGDDVEALVIPGGDSVDGTFVPFDTTYTMETYSPDSTFYWNIVSIQAHTHKLGTNFNVWTRNSLGQKDSLIYNGQYNTDYSEDIYDYVWNDPPYRLFDPIMPVYMTNGLISQATYRNTTPDTVSFGLLTTDEMFVTFVLYYESEFPAVAGINAPVFTDNNIKMYPNPASDLEYIRLDENLQLLQTEMQFYDVLGTKVLDLNSVNSHVFTADMSNLADGVYVYQLINNGNNIGSGKIVVQH